jgi:hypothetical protein
MRYRPRAVSLGIAVSAATALVVAAWLFWMRRRSARAETGLD